MRPRKLPARLEWQPCALPDWLANLVVHEVLEQLAWCERGGCLHAGVVYMRPGSCPLRKLAKEIEQ